MSMFDFLSMADNYEERKIDRFKNDDMVIDTCSVNDGRLPYETGIAHKEYNEGKWIIVEAYSDKEFAQKGHEKWVLFMTGLKPPDFLQDCQNAEVSRLLDFDYLKFYRKTGHEN